MTSKKISKKKLQLKKETVTELTPEQLNNVAGGVTGNCATGEGHTSGCPAASGVQTCSNSTCYCPAHTSVCNK